MSLGAIAAQAQARMVEPDKTVHKWKVFSALSEAKDRLALPDRALAVLNALISFHPETTLTAGDRLVVFPSNEKLAARAHGVAPATLRRHLAILVAAGIVIRRDSPNGKRYARRSEGGAVAEAFGFDLTPLVARAEEFERLAAEVAAEKRALRLARERITLARRDITKLITLGLEEGIAGDWAGAHAAYLGIVSRLKRSAGQAGLSAIAEELAELASTLTNQLETFVNLRKTSANESHFERHKQNSNPDQPELEPASEKARGGEGGPDPEGEGATGTAAEPAMRPAPGIALGLVLEACPDIVDYAEAPSGPAPAIRSWPDLIKTAALVRAMLGVSPDAWRDAVETLGIVDASILIAAILQKGDAIRFPGGYLRALTEKKRAGQFAIGPILMALIGTKLKAMRGGKGTS